MWQPHVQPHEHDARMLLRITKGRVIEQITTLQLGRLFVANNTCIRHMRAPVVGAACRLQEDRCDVGIQNMRYPGWRRCVQVEHDVRDERQDRHLLRTCIQSATR